VFGGCPGTGARSGVPLQTGCCAIARDGPAGSRRQDTEPYERRAGSGAIEPAYDAQAKRSRIPILGRVLRIDEPALEARYERLRGAHAHGQFTLPNIGHAAMPGELAEKCTAILGGSDEQRQLRMLERDLGKPVYSAVQASAWQAYEAMNVDPKILDCGSLLRKLSEPGAQKKAVKQLRSA